jgi:hypothetical protein
VIFVKNELILVNVMIDDDDEDFLNDQIKLHILLQSRLQVIIVLEMNQQLLVRSLNVKVNVVEQIKKNWRVEIIVKFVRHQIRSMVIRHEKSNDQIY